MKRRGYLLIHSVALVFAVCLITRCHAAIISLSPFQGTASENFDHLGLTGAQQLITVLGGNATVSNLTSGGALKLEFSSSLNGDQVVPRSSPLMLGQIGISQWVFQTPLTKFGGYFENNSRFDGATVDFYDVNNQIIASEIVNDPNAAQTWTWNGWQSDIPIHRMVVTGNDVGFLNGFIWFDDVQTVAIVPEPQSIPFLLVSGGLFHRFGRRRRVS
jgi:hypothetical protein